MFDELDVVALTHNIVEHDLSEGSVGTIVQLYKDGDAFAVEFVNDEGYTTALLDLTSKDVRLVWSKNMCTNLNIPYSTQSFSKTSDKEEYWTSVIKLHLKQDSDNLFTPKFAFFS